MMANSKEKSVNSNMFQLFILFALAVNKVGALHFTFAR